jgi:hypothetical protein
MSDERRRKTDEAGVSRRGALECMIWAGTGVLWTLSGGVPKSLGLLGDALAAESAGFTFLQISDSHIGFSKPANPDALGTLREAIAKVKAVTTKPAFMIHTGDITHLSKPDEFDNADQVIGEAKLDVHYVPGEHDSWTRVSGRLISPLWQGHQGLGLVQLRRPRRAFHRPRQCGRPQGRWSRASGERAARLARRRPQGQVDEHADRRVRPYPPVETAPSPGPMTVPAEQLRSVLGIASVEVRTGDKPLAITDTPLAG